MITPGMYEVKHSCGGSEKLLFEDVYCASGVLDRVKRPKYGLKVMLLLVSL